MKLMNMTILSLVLLCSTAHSQSSGGNGSSGNGRAGVAIPVAGDAGLNGQDVWQVVTACEEQLVSEVARQKFGCEPVVAKGDWEGKVFCKNDTFRRAELHGSGIRYGLLRIIEGKLKVGEDVESQLKNLPRTRFNFSSGIELTNLNGSAYFKIPKDQWFPIVLGDFESSMHTVDGGSDELGKHITNYVREENNNIVNPRIMLSSEPSDRQILINESCQDPHGVPTPQDPGDSKCVAYVNTKAYMQCLQSGFANIKK